MTEKIVITGATSGIGKNCAELFSKHGYDVYGTVYGIDMDPEWEKLSYKLYPCNITNQASVEEFVNWVMKKADKIDVLVNCAGFGFGGGVEDSTTEEVMLQFNVNFFGTHRITRQILPIMRKQRSGKILTISSMASEFGIPFQGFYSASKMALDGMIMALRMESRPYGIQAATINPGDVKSDFTVNRGLAAACKEDGPYYENSMKSIQQMIKDEQNGMDVSEISDLVLKLIRKKRLKPKYLVESKYKILMFMKNFMSNGLVESLLMKYYQ